MSRSKVKVTRDKNALRTAITPQQQTNGPFCCMMRCNALAANNVMQQQTRPFRRCWGMISAACVQFVFGFYQTQTADVSHPQSRVT